MRLRTNASIGATRETGRVVAHVPRSAREAAAVGVSPRELDEVAREVPREAGADSPFPNHRPRFTPTPFPAVVRTSVDDATAPGVTTGQRLRDGDPVSIDAGATPGGRAGDSTIDFTVGGARPADTRLIDTAFAALEAGIAAAAAGNRIGDIAHAIGTVCRAADYGIPEEFGGHGIGRSTHEDPAVPDEGRPGRDMRLRHGMAPAVDPMPIGGGTDGLHPDRDGWTLRTSDGSRVAHAEHTVAITDDGPRIPTAPEHPVTHSFRVPPGPLVRIAPHSHARRRSGPIRTKDPSCSG